MSLCLLVGNSDKRVKRPFRILQLRAGVFLSVHRSTVGVLFVSGYFHHAEKVLDLGSQTSPVHGLHSVRALGPYLLSFCAEGWERTST